MIPVLEPWEQGKPERGGSWRFTSVQPGHGVQVPTILAF
jgi:hypothetical protein